MTFSPDFFRRHRNELSRKLSMPIILTAHREMQRNNDGAYAFEQEANFWYITGIESPDWKVVIDGIDEWLVAPDVDPIHQVFDGSLSWDDARKISGINTVISQSEGSILLHKLAKKHKTVFTLGKDPREKYYDFAVNPSRAQLERKLKKLFSEVQDCRRELAQLRAAKQPEEIAAIRQAVKLTTEAFEEVKTTLSSSTHEYQVEAAFTHYFRSSGATGHAYDPIVASGMNACTLHYVKNSEALAENQLLLIDIGARSEGYAADITRTFAIGKPTERQKAVHEAVEKAHHQIIGLLKPDVRIDDYIKRVDEVMESALDSLGLLASKSDYRKYFPHAISHGLGIDVHDSLGGPEVFKAGMVLTVEPGIYIPEEGIGVRIEDDILITESGHENLSASLPTSL